MASKPSPHILVLGAGVTGLTSALFLAEVGYGVTVVAAHMPGDESWEYTSPWYVRSRHATCLLSFRTTPSCFQRSRVSLLMWFVGEERRMFFPPLVSLYRYCSVCLSLLQLSSVQHDV